MISIFKILQKSYLYNAKKRKMIKMSKQDKQNFEDTEQNDDKDYINENSKQHNINY
ncbi:transcription factor with AP2 domain(s), putative [Plasmodium malariae]|uniref:Transcription factor with AP2 domain(S), putative n=1 Tax=Plasmodium malariae TaxID=5858 RepID=A0A1C3L030_PLAMA|nr:transcription factor with AP2 domain(s), putative [Plasmodium malariae]